jgi:hypothetical protein
MNFLGKEWRQNAKRQWNVTTVPSEQIVYLKTTTAGGPSPSGETAVIV